MRHFGRLFHENLSIIPAARELTIGGMLAEREQGVKTNDLLSRRRAPARGEQFLISIRIALQVD